MRQISWVNTAPGAARVALNQNTLFKAYYSRSNCERDKTRIRLLIKQAYKRALGRGARPLWNRFARSVFLRSLFVTIGRPIVNNIVIGVTPRDICTIITTRNDRYHGYSHGVTYFAEFTGHVNVSYH